MIQIQKTNLRIKIQFMMHNHESCAFDVVLQAIKRKNLFHLLIYLGTNQNK